MDGFKNGYLNIDITKVSYGLGKDISYLSIATSLKYLWVV